MTAHPAFPHRRALAAFLKRGVKKEEVPSRIELLYMVLQTIA